nr:RNA-directed DNA polymerase, eukaryota, reverse transcriptase zinc-binding domain protein [Tanacetum cinerariifolium]
MVFKIDFAKAYDSIQWDYLGDVLKSFGFGVKWCIKIDSSTTLSHLFYADDAVFIDEWSRGNLTGFRACYIDWLFGFSYAV